MKEYIENDLYEYLLAHPEEVLCAYGRLIEGKPIPSVEKKKMTAHVMLFMNKSYPAYDRDFRHSWSIGDFKGVFKAAHKEAILLYSRAFGVE